MPKAWFILPEALQKLEKKVKRGFQDPSDWWMLARTYTEQKRFPDASNAYERLVVLVPNEAQLWANYADVYAMAHGQTLQNDEVTKMISKSLELDPNNNTALALAGSAAMERGDYAYRDHPLANAGRPAWTWHADAQVYIGGLKRAAELLVKQPGGKEKLAQLTSGKASAKSARNSAAAITGKVSLSRALAGKVSPDDTVFILARAAQGPKMPLAVMRKQVKDLPLKFTLDDSMAMQPQLKLSGFAQGRGGGAGVKVRLADGASRRSAGHDRNHQTGHQRFEHRDRQRHAVASRPVCYRGI